MPRFVLLLLLLTACCCPALYAQNSSGWIAGQVLDAAGKPIELVSVSVKATGAGVATDAEGRFRLAAPAGAQQLRVSSIGYTSLDIPVQVEAGQTTTLAPVTAEVNNRQLAEVQVLGRKSMNEKSVSIGKMPVRPLDLPQSVVSLDHAVLEQQQTLRLSDALANVSGVYVMGTSGGTQEELAGRGFAFTSSNTFKNGVRYNNAVMPEVSSLERLEVLKGSNAILFGNVAAGGVINLVTKKPQFTQGGELSVRAVSYNFYKPSVDVYGAVNNSEKVAYRMNTSYENSGSFRDGVTAERFYVNPSLLVKAGAKTDVLLEGDFLKDRRTSDFGTAAINYVIADVPRNQFLGVRWGYNQTTQQSATATVTHHFTETWQLRGVAAVQQYTNDLFTTVRPNSGGRFVRDNGNWVRGLQRSGVEERYYLAQLDLTGKLHTGAVEHTVLLGADADQYHTNTLAYDNSKVLQYDSINVFDLNKYKQRNDIPDLARKTRTTNGTRRAGFYAQDLVSLTEKLKVLAGLRWTYQETPSDLYDYAKATTTSTRDFASAFTPRVGVVYQPRKTTALFASYANSFTLNTGVDVAGKALPPTFVDQYEIGLKNDLFKGFLSANLTAYQIINGNLAQNPIGEANPNIKELAGEVTSKGVELDVLSKAYQGWSFIAGYSFNDTRYTKSNTYEVGSRLRYNPSHTANASVFYTLDHSVLKGLSGGLTTLYIGDRVAGRSTRLVVSGKPVTNDSYKLMRIPNYTQLDASLGYALERLSLRVKVSNVLNKLSYNVHDDNSVNPIAPRLYSATLAYKL